MPLALALAYWPWHWLIGLGLLALALVYWPWSWLTGIGWLTGLGFACPPLSFEQELSSVDALGLGLPALALASGLGIGVDTCGHVNIPAPDARHTYRCCESCIPTARRRIQCCPCSTEPVVTYRRTQTDRTRTTAVHTALADWLNQVSRPTRHFGDVLPSQSLGSVLKKTTPKILI